MVAWRKATSCSTWFALRMAGNSSHATSRWCNLPTLPGREQFGECPHACANACSACKAVRAKLHLKFENAFGVPWKDKRMLFQRLTGSSKLGIPRTCFSIEEVRDGAPLKRVVLPVKMAFAGLTRIWSLALSSRHLLGRRRSTSIVVAVQLWLCSCERLGRTLRPGSSRRSGPVAAWVSAPRTWSAFLSFLRCFFVCLLVICLSVCSNTHRQFPHRLDTRT